MIPRSNASTAMDEDGQGIVIIVNDEPRNVNANHIEIRGGE